MLRSLTIRDFAIVDRLELDFSPGFTALTGETGAGKSILIDALAMVLGERAEAIVVREGAERAEVGAEFDVAAHPPAARWLEVNDFAGDEGGCVLRRVIEATGRSRAYVNGAPATLVQLRELGELLVEIHGQHEHQSLTRAAAQRDLIDDYGGLAEAASRVAALHREWGERRRRREESEAGAARAAGEREELEWQARELAALNPAPGEWPDLTARHARLSHAASLIEAARSAVELLAEGEDSAQAQARRVASKLGALLEFDPALREAHELVEAARIDLSEAAHSLRRYADRIELDPAALRGLEQRIEALHAAARRFRVAPEALPERLAEARARLDALEARGDVEGLRAAEAQALAACRAEAKTLSAGRRRAAKRLSDEVSEAMQELAMAGGRFEVSLAPLAEVGAGGAEDVGFLVAAHQGAEPRPLARVASGGELSRLALAIQAAAARVARVPTLIFDEVDSGIGGRVAEIVGGKLRALAAGRQVMCITHLAQVAAAANHQWQVRKSVTGGRAVSRVAALGAADRVEEIARMLGGVKITETTRRHAAEMLKGGERRSARSET
ncbi:MAG: DNA repair protein RecN [Burkholderiales bacterium]|nr:DNA repair protein RecN [Burkholderiales bacterium]